MRARTLPHRAQDNHCEKQVADQQPSCTNDTVRDDDQCEHERDQKEGVPQPRRPTEEGGYGLPVLLVGPGSRPSNHSFEPDHSGRSRDQ